MSLSAIWNDLSTTKDLRKEILFVLNTLNYDILLTFFFNCHQCINSGSFFSVLSDGCCLLLTFLTLRRSCHHFFSLHFHKNFAPPLLSPQKVTLLFSPRRLPSLQILPISGLFDRPPPLIWFQRRRGRRERERQI